MTTVKNLRPFFKHFVYPNPTTISQVELPLIRLCIIFSGFFTICNEFILEDRKTTLMCILATLMFSISYMINSQIYKYSSYIVVSQY